LLLLLLLPSSLSVTLLWESMCMDRMGVHTCNNCSSNVGDTLRRDRKAKGCKKTAAPTGVNNDGRRSQILTEYPRCRNAWARTNPAGPAPTMPTSASMIMFEVLLLEVVADGDGGGGDGTILPLAEEEGATTVRPWVPVTIQLLENNKDASPIHTSSNIIICH
jgi:hypothetical protein